jgi:imidazolonepropionase-like amidohydrolase
MEAIDGIRANIALVHIAGARAIVHSDDPGGSQRLNQEAAKALAAGRAAGLNLTEDDAIRWITINPAWSVGLQDRIGSIEAGKNADVVLWSANPFSVYARAEKVWVDGAMLYDRADPRRQWRTDFELGWVPLAGAAAPAAAPAAPAVRGGGAR